MRNSSSIEKCLVKINIKSWITVCRRMIIIFNITLYNRSPFRSMAFAYNEYAEGRAIMLFDKNKYRDETQFYKKRKLKHC